MKMIERLRGWMFWSMDYLTGSSIRKHLNDIRSSMSNKQFDTEGVRRNLLLKNLIHHAITYCKYYDGYREDAQLSDFPVVNKFTIKDNYDRLLASNMKKGLVSVTTSGSTGTPFTVYHDRNKRRRNYADTLYFGGLAGYILGHRLLYLKIWVKQKMKSRFSYWLQNTVPIDVIQLNDPQIEKIIRRIESDNSTFGILSYASALESLCKVMEKKHYYSAISNIRSVIAISESLNDYTRVAIQKYFKMPVVSRYSNLENGIIAQQLISDKTYKFLINTASYFVEILEMDSDNPAQQGQLGRIVITDLFNYAMPMIRYDTGDIGAMESNPDNPCETYFTRIEGRKLDILYDTRGNIVSSFLVYKNMWQYTDIDQYQLIQETLKSYRFKINMRPPFNNEDKLISEFKSILGDDAEFEIEYVSEIPLLSSGKRKMIVSRLNKT